MPELTIEIHDTGLLIADETGPVTVPVPGYALVTGGGVSVGDDALHGARLHPREIHNRFWERLATSPLGRPFPPDLTYADLAHAHLVHAWHLVPEAIRDDTQGVVLALPGTLSDEQLGLVVGIARACDIPVAGMVDLAVAAAASTTPVSPRALHLDLHLHRLVITEIERGIEIVRRDVDASTAVGIVALHDAWARRIAELFVRATRFDPLHSAASEQGLYSSLTHVAARLGEEDSAELVLDAQGRELTIEVHRDDLIAAAEPLYNQLVELVEDAIVPGMTLLLAPSVAAAPGLADRLASLGTVDVLSLGAAAAGVAASDAFCETAQETLTFVTCLPGTPAPAIDDEPTTDEPPTPWAPPPPPPCPPTHLLYNGIAYKIPDAGGRLRLGSKPGAVVDLIAVVRPEVVESEVVKPDGAA